MMRRRLPFRLTSLAGLLVVLGSPARANPIFVPNDSYSATKSWERCLVAMDKQGASVSCAIGYTLKESDTTDRVPSSKLKFELPVFVPVATAANENETAKFCTPRLELEGSVLPSEQMRLLSPESSHNSYRVPEGVQVALFTFSVTVGQFKRATAAVFTYRQPLIEGDFLYMPLFENNQDPPPAAEFSLTAFPATPEVSLTLRSRNKSIKANLQTRILLDLRHRDLIAIQAR